MNCRELEGFVDPYLDGEFEADARAEMEQHLAGCPHCAARLHSEAKYREAIRARMREALQSTRAPESLRARVTAGLVSERRRQATSRWMAVGAAAAAVVVVAGSATYVYRHHRAEKFVEYAAGGWVHTNQLPLDIRDSSAPKASAWLAERLAHRVPVPRFPNATVLGARVSHVADKPAALVAYDTADAQGEPRRIGLFVFDDADREVPTEAYPAVQMATDRGYNVAMWREGEIVYEMVTDLDENAIRALLRAKGNAAVVPESNDDFNPEIAQPVSFQPASVPNASFQPASFQPASFQR